MHKSHKEALYLILDGLNLQWNKAPKPPEWRYDTQVFTTPKVQRSPNWSRTHKVSQTLVRKIKNIKIEWLL